MNVQVITNKTNDILRAYGVKKAALFGSHARNEASETSDVDILVDLSSGMSLLDFIGLKQELEEALNKKVDLVQYKQVKPVLADYILKEEVVFYQA